MAGRGVAERLGVGVEHQHAQGDELVAPLELGHLCVEVLEGLAGIPELEQEGAEQVLGLERRDRRLDAVAGHVTDHGPHPVVVDLEHVVEVTGHRARAGLVGRTDLEPLQVWQAGGRQPGRPLQRSQLVLGQHLAGLLLDLAAGGGDALDLGQLLAADEGEDGGDGQHARCPRHQRRRLGDHDRHEGDDREDRADRSLEVSPVLGVGEAPQIGVDLLGREPARHLVAGDRGADPDRRGCGTRHSGEQGDEPFHGVRVVVVDRRPIDVHTADTGPAARISPNVTDDYSLRRRTRSLIGVGPISNASRRLRSRYRM